MLWVSMANEAVLKVETHVPINFDCSTDVTIEKGTICKMTDAMGAAASAAADDIVAGICQSEKLAAETSQNSVAIFRGGVFRVTVSDTVSMGDPVVTGLNANTVRLAATNEEHILGIMLEDGTNGQFKLMELRPTTMQLA